MPAAATTSSPAASTERPEDVVTQALANLGLVEEDAPLLAAPRISDFKRKEDSGMLRPEPLLVENPHRYVIFPIQHQDVSSAPPSRPPSLLLSTITAG